MKKGNKYGTHRVIEPQGVLPQPATKVDNNVAEIYDNEILIDFFYDFWSKAIKYPIPS